MTLSHSSRPFVLALLGLPAGMVLHPREALAQIDPDAGRASFQSGRARYDRGDFDGALRDFQSSLSALPSPNTMLYIGRALRELGRLSEAWRAFIDASDDARRRSLAEPRYARTAESAHSEAGQVASRLAFITVTVPDAPAGTVVELNGRPLEATRWNSPQPVDPPSLTVDARSPGRNPFHTSNTVSAGLQAQVSVSFDPASQSPASTPLNQNAVLVTTHSSLNPSGTVGPSGFPWRTVGVVVMGLGAASVIAGVVFGLRARASESDLEIACPQGCANSTQLQGLIADGYQSSLLANVSFGLGAGLLAAGTLAVLLGRPGEIGFTPEIARVSPYVDPAQGVAGLRGAF